MLTIQTGRQLSSFFSAVQNIQALTKNKLFVTIVGAFFVVAALGVALNAVQAQINNRLTASPSVMASEPVAYLPGQMITHEIQRGYIGP